MKEDNGFIVKYTNKDIMDKLEVIETKIERSNGKANKALIVSGTALTVTLIVLTILIEHIGRVN
jgi:hypothetical protein